MTPDALATYRELVDYDWLVTRAWNRLHHATLTDDQVAEIADGVGVQAAVRLDCGRVASWVSIPGLFTRMGAMRCADCCRANGLPPGKGSPKNDDECRRLLGLPAQPTGGVL